MNDPVKLNNPENTPFDTRTWHLSQNTEQVIADFLDKQRHFHCHGANLNDNIKLADLKNQLGTRI